MINVAILIHSQPAMFELGCALELFALPRPEYSNWYRTQVVTFHSQPVTASGGITIQAAKVNSLANYDLLVVPGWSVQAIQTPQSLMAEILDLYVRGGRIISFCSGAFLLAESGLLDHRQACTHWRYQAQFQERFPHIELVDQVLYCFDGRIGCSAGSAAGLDLGLELIRQDHGYQIANQVARRLVISPHRSGGQSQFVETPIPKTHRLFSATLDWALKHLDQAIEVSDLALQAHMSRRSFDRHFRQTMNMTAKEWLNRQRVERARVMLEQAAQQSLEQVAAQCGFHSAMNMRLNFHKYLTISPSEYRNRFAVRHL